jgi:AraC-like DNA-binding protein
MFVRRAVASRFFYDEMQKMPDTATSAFSEPEDFEAALRKGGCLNLLITGRGRFRAQLTLVTLHRVCLSAAEEQLSRIAFIAVPADMVIAVFAIGSGTLPVRGAVAERPGEITILPPGEQMHVRTDGPRRWGSIWIPAEEWVRHSGALTGNPFAAPPTAQRWRPSRAAGRCLRRLHTAAIRMAATRPQILVNGDAAHGLEQQLIYALVECLSSGAGDKSTRSERRHLEIMARLEHLLQAQPDRQVRVKEMCTALGVSERLLRGLCAEHLGMSIVRYDRLRRMSLARLALRRGGPRVVSVSDVAARYGFRQLGRFSVDYRTAFGETPSATLRRGSSGYTVEPGRALTHEHSNICNDR